MIERILAALFAASRLRLPAARAMGYAAAVNGASEVEIAQVVAVLTEGAMHGPDAARGMAAELGG